PRPSAPDRASQAPALAAAFLRPLAATQPVDQDPRDVADASGVDRRLAIGPPALEPGVLDDRRQLGIREVRPGGQRVRGGRDSLRRQLEDVPRRRGRSEEHTSELQSLAYLVCRLL